MFLCKELFPIMVFLIFTINNSSEVSLVSKWIQKVEDKQKKGSASFVPNSIIKWLKNREKMKGNDTTLPSRRFNFISKLFKTKSKKDKNKKDGDQTKLKTESTKKEPKPYNQSRQHKLHTPSNSIDKLAEKLDNLNLQKPKELEGDDVINHRNSFMKSLKDSKSKSDTLIMSGHTCNGQKGNIYR